MSGMDPGRLAAIMSSRGPAGTPAQPPPPNFPMLPGMGGAPPPNIDLAQMQKQLEAQGIHIPPNFNIPPNFAAAMGGMPGFSGNGMPDRGRR